jgi:hypothetical protein
VRNHDDHQHDDDHDNPADDHDSPDDDRYSNNDDNVHDRSALHRGNFCTCTCIAPSETVVAW